MPQLTSGRHFGLEPPDFEQMTRALPEDEAFALLLAYRQEVRSPTDLIRFFHVIYFDTKRGTPPAAPPYRSGLLVRDILEGSSDWSDAEVQEFQRWLEGNEGLAAWAEENFSEAQSVFRRMEL